MNKNLILLFIVFFLFQIPLFFSLSPADENVYYYMGKVVAEGVKPYEQFFHAHPPLQIYLYAGIIKLFGVHLWVLKLTTYLFNVGSAIFIYLIAKERYDKKTAIIATLLFLLSFGIFVFGSFATGLEIALLFFLASLYFNKRHPLLSGVLFGLCLMTRLHFAPLGIVLLLNTKQKSRFMLGSSIFILYYALLMNIPNFFNNVFDYHIIKITYSKPWLRFMGNNLPLLCLFVFSLGHLKDKLLIYLGIVYLLFITIAKSAFEYYFVLIMVILCIEGAWALTYFSHRKMFWGMMCFWFILVLFKCSYIVFEQTDNYDSFATYISTFDGSIMGESSIAALLALKTNKNITRNMIDLNFQRRDSFNYSDSLVIYMTGKFPGKKFNCSFNSSNKVGKIEYDLWRC